MGRTYTTIQGDMWDSIAHTQLGDVAYTDRLIRANRQFIGHYTFPAGVVLRLPEIRPEVSKYVPPWKKAQA